MAVQQLIGCSHCGQSVVPGALMCGACGSPSVVNMGQVQALIVVEGGQIGLSMTLPGEGVEWQLGRHDLVRTPPWIVDVDLGRLMNLPASEGPPVSREQASITRRAGELLLTPKGQAPVFHKSAAAVSYVLLSTGNAHPLKLGDRIAFGHSGHVLVLEAQ